MLSGGYYKFFVRLGLPVAGKATGFEDGIVNGSTIDKHLDRDRLALTRTIVRPPLCARQFRQFLRRELATVLQAHATVVEREFDLRGILGHLPVDGPG